MYDAEEPLSLTTQARIPYSCKIDLRIPYSSAGCNCWIFEKLPRTIIENHLKMLRDICLGRAVFQRKKKPNRMSVLFSIILVLLNGWTVAIRIRESRQELLHSPTPVKPTLEWSYQIKLLAFLCHWWCAIMNSPQKRILQHVVWIKLKVLI
jgi:hypothetical protein